MQRLRLLARLVNAAPSLIALLQFDAGRAWKDDLACDVALLRREMGPQLAEVEVLPDFERLWLEHPEAWPSAHGALAAGPGSCPADLQLRPVRCVASSELFDRTK